MAILIAIINPSLEVGIDVGIYAQHPSQLPPIRTKLRHTPARSLSHQSSRSASDGGEGPLATVIRR